MISRSNRSADRAKEKEERSEHLDNPDGTETRTMDSCFLSSEVHVMGKASLFSVYDWQLGQKATLVTRFQACIPCLKGGND